MNALTKLNPAIRPRTMGREAYSTIAAIKNRLYRDPEGNTWLAPTDMPNPTIRKRMEGRRTELLVSLTPARAGDISDQVATCFLVMRSRGGDEIDASAVQRIYAGDLHGIPLFAIVAACADFRQGHVGDGKWVPEPAPLRARAMALARLFVDELADIEAILSAKPLVVPASRCLSVEERRAAIERARGVVRAMVEASSPFPPRRPAADFRRRDAELIAAEDQLAAVAAQLLTPPKISRELAEKLKAHPETCDPRRVSCGALPKHDANDEGCGDAGAAPVVMGEAAVAADPAECALDDPSLGAARRSGQRRCA